MNFIDILNLFDVNKFIKICIVGKSGIILQETDCINIRDILENSYIIKIFIDNVLLPIDFCNKKICKIDIVDSDLFYESYFKLFISTEEMNKNEKL